MDKMKREMMNDEWGVISENKKPLSFIHRSSFRIHHFRLVLFILSALILSILFEFPASAQTRRAKRALVISLDGLDARYLNRRDEYALKIPTLRRLIAEGVAARGVISVYPSVTYPAHTTMVTGAVPRRHGIYSNEVFEPPVAPQTRSWYWFARDIKTETLWDAAQRAGLKSGCVSWPVAAGACDWSVPEIWKQGMNPGDSLEATLGEIRKHARPSGIIQEVMSRDAKLFLQVTKDEGDDMRTRFAEYVIEQKRPHLMLVHLFDLDHFQHEAGPFTPEAFAILEKSDAYVARLLAAAERAGTLSETAIFIVSDHGFYPVTHDIRPNVLLARAGLLKLSGEKDARGRPVVTDWRAFALQTSGSCAIILRDPKDGEALRMARAAFRELEGQEDGGARARGQGVVRVVNSERLSKMGSTPRAAFVLEGLRGHKFSRDMMGEVVSPSSAKSRGTHGYLPASPDYRASFVASGAGVSPARGASLGTINMLDIGPTVARTLGLKLRDADGRPLKID